MWALSSAVTDRETAELAALDGGSSEVLAPLDFATYAGWVSLTLIGAHLLMDRVWPARGWTMSRAGRVATIVLLAGLGTLMAVVAVPWAPIKFAAIGWIVVRLARRHGGESGEPTLLDAFGGRIRPTSLLPVALLPGVASGVYALMWPVRNDASMEVVFWTLIAIQVAAGFIAAGWLLWPRRRADTKADPGAAAEQA